VRGSRALLCTSHSSFAEAFSAQLTTLGFEVEAVSDPEHALDLRRANPPLLFWIDDTLPNLELHQLRRALIEEDLPGDTKYILLHGPNDKQPHEGFDAHINRPPRPSLLRALTLQLCEDSVRAALPRATDEPLEAPPTPKPDRARYSGRVLVVEDNAVNRRVVTALLEKRGIEVETATNGHEALTMLRIVSCDLILMDVQMPEMDGIEATRRIRGGEAGTCLDVPIVALTAGDQPEDRMACHEVGMDDYIRKPLTQSDLDQVLGKWLREVTLLED